MDQAVRHVTGSPVPSARQLPLIRRSAGPTALVRCWGPATQEQIVTCIRPDWGYDHLQQLHENNVGYELLRLYVGSDGWGCELHSVCYFHQSIHMQHVFLCRKF